MRSWFLILLLFIASFFATAQNTDAVKETVMMKMWNLKNALISKDSAALENLLAEDVTYGHSSGLIQTKQQLIHDVVTGAQVYKTIEPSNMNIRVFGNAAIVTMNSHMIVAGNGNTMDMNLFVTLTWIKENSDWKLEARQAVKQQ